MYSLAYFTYFKYSFYMDGFVLFILPGQLGESSNK